MSFELIVRLPEPLRRGGVNAIVVDTPVSNLRELRRTLASRIDGFASEDVLYNFAVNGEMILVGESDRSLRSGDEVDLLVAFSGG